MGVDTKLREMLRPYETGAIADALGLHADTVRAWKRGEQVPSIDRVRPLSEFLRRDFAEVAAAVADAAEGRRAS